MTFLECSRPRFGASYNTVRPNRAVNRRTPARAFAARTDSKPRPRLDNGGKGDPLLPRVLGAKSVSRCRMCVLTALWRAESHKWHRDCSTPGVGRRYESYCSSPTATCG
jgi:hypothetical protein